MPHVGMGDGPLTEHASAIIPEKPPSAPNVSTSLACPPRCSERLIAAGFIVKSGGGGSTAVSVIEAELFFEFKSGWVPTTCWESENVPAIVRRTPKSIVADEGSARAPSSQVITVVPLHVPWLGCADTNFQPAGSVSVHVTLVASCRPPFKIVARKP